MPRPVALLTGLLLVAAAPASRAVATIEPDFAAPVVLMSEYELRDGDTVDLTIAGFTSRVVTVSVCGNRALRGSSDCNMTASESVLMKEDGSSVVFPLEISPPPTPCPCLIRVSSPSNDQVASAEFTLVNHGVAEPVGSLERPVALAASLTVEDVSEGFGTWLRSSLGGATAYEATLRVRNSSTDRVEGVAVSGSVSARGDDSTALIDLPDPGMIEAGATWERSVRVELPAPVFGSAEWRVIVSGPGPTVTATDSTSQIPGVLVLLALVLSLDVLWLLVRQIRRGLRRRAARDDAPHEEADMEAVAATSVDREPVPV